MRSLRMPDLAPSLSEAEPRAALPSAERGSLVLTYDPMRHPPHHEPHQDLLRQAYLLTGDHDGAYRLADRAAAAGQFHGRRHEPGDALEYAKSESVRSFVAEAGPPRSRPSEPAPPNSDIAVWQAVCRLSPRRRAAIVLRYDEGLTEEQAAARLGTSAQTVRADVDAAMLTLRTALPGVGDPWNSVADALAAAGRGWSDYARPAPRQVADVLAAPRPARSAEPVPASPTRRSLRPALITAGVAAAVLLGTAVAVPRLTRDAPAPTAPVAAAPAAVAQQVAPRGARLSVPTRRLPEGLLNWPARGARAQDAALLAAAGRAWRAKAPAAEAPASGLAVLWAGSIQGRTVVVMQALDRSGSPRLAQVSGASATTLGLQHAEPLHPTQVLSILPPNGPTGPVRVLVSPEGQVATACSPATRRAACRCRPPRSVPTGSRRCSPPRRARRPAAGSSCSGWTRRPARPPACAFAGALQRGRRRRHAHPDGDGGRGRHRVPGPLGRPAGDDLVHRRRGARGEGAGQGHADRGRARSPGRRPAAVRRGPARGVLPGVRAAARKHPLPRLRDRRRGEDHLRVGLSGRYRVGVDRLGAPVSGARRDDARPGARGRRSRGRPRRRRPGADPVAGRPGTARGHVHPARGRAGQRRVRRPASRPDGLPVRPRHAAGPPRRGRHHRGVPVYLP